MAIGNQFWIEILIHKPSTLCVQKYDIGNIEAPDDDINVVSERWRH
jgi:hypothetical protein